MKHFIKHIDKKTLYDFFSCRENEVKIGQCIRVVDNLDNIEEEIQSKDIEFVILGIAEDIGVRANLGRAGAHSAFHAVLRSFLSMQQNRFLDAHKILLLGEVYVDDIMTWSRTLNPKNKNDLDTLRKLVEEIDKRVLEVAKLVFKHHKIPIIIGGGHNNSFPIIQAVTDVLHKPINVINCDAHSDLRPMEGRHSGNAFRYAIEKGYINQYFILGLHEQYTAENILEYIHHHTINYYTYEDIFVREKILFQDALRNMVMNMKHVECGIELDVDAITNVPSSARTSSGISPIDARKYVYICGNTLNCVYLYLAEAAPETAHLRADYKTGKLLAYLICDFIKGINDRKNGIA